MAQKRKKVSTKVSEVLWKRLRVASLVKGKTAAELLEEALERQLDEWSIPQLKQEEEEK